MNNQDFDRLLDSIRRDVPDGTDAAERVRQKLNESAPANSLCTSFRADFSAMRAGTLGEARRLLLEDHLHSCVACRRDFSGDGDRVMTMPPSRRPQVFRHWAAAAAAAVVVAGAAWALPPVLDRALAPSGARGTVASIEGTLVAVSSQGAETLKVGAEIAQGQKVRTGRESRAIVRLRDGSMVEMRERSEMSLIERWRSKTIRLDRGSVIVEAAKQRNGRLEVATTDARVTVKGTIFGVSMGLKGSRVSVVEGEVHVDALTTGDETVLYRGEQTTTDPAIETSTVVDDVAWSQNAAKYIALLADLQSAGERISRIPMPGLRFTSKLLDRVPVDSVVVVSVPNISPMVDEAERIFEDKARESAAMAEWWNTSGAQAMKQAMMNVKAIGGFLGEEIVVGIGKDRPPVILGEVQQDGLVDELRREGYTLPVSFDGNIVAMGLAAVPGGGFTSTPFGAKLLERYSSGAGLLFAANAEQFSPPSVVTPAGVPIGFENLRYVIAEQKGSLQAPVQTAMIAFNGERTGLASWLAAPGPMGSLEFVSPDATFAAAFVSRDPRDLLDELIKMSAPIADTSAGFWAHAGVNVLDDIAGSLGAEATITLDGALLPTPSWKVAIEVDSAERLQWAIEQIAAATPQYQPQNPLKVTSEAVDGRTYYTVTPGDSGAPINYTFVDGYWLIAPSRALLMKAIQDRDAALTLPRSAPFRAQMPVDGQAFFSALLYFNMAPMVGPMADQLKASGLLDAETQSKLDAVTANRTPGLVYVYGEPDRIQVGSRSNLMQMGLQTLAAISSGNVTGMPMGILKGPQ
jgi:ferric-dicitrate binding protein FerR (iron transport regulator)